MTIEIINIYAKFNIVDEPVDAIKWFGIFNIICAIITVTITDAACITPIFDSFIKLSFLLIFPFSTYIVFF